MEIDPSIGDPDYMYDFSFIDLTGINFNKCHTKHCTFYGSILDKCDFTEACLCCVDLRHTSIRDANFTSATDRGMNIKGADLTGSNIDKLWRNERGQTAKAYVKSKGAIYKEDN